MYKKILSRVAAFAIGMSVLTGCGTYVPTGAEKDVAKTLEIGAILQGNQPTPTDINYSLERFNHIRRAYWVNGQREKAMSLTVPIQRPLGYIVLMSESGAVVGNFIVDGKVSSLQNYLTPTSESYDVGSSTGRWDNDWLADTDGTFGDNPEGIFFFTPDGKYLEWTGTYLYSDIPFSVENPVLEVE